MYDICSTHGTKTHRTGLNREQPYESGVCVAGWISLSYLRRFPHAELPPLMNGSSCKRASSMSFTPCSAWAGASAALPYTPAVLLKMAGKQNKTDPYLWSGMARFERNRRQVLPGRPPTDACYIKGTPRYRKLAQSGMAPSPQPTAVPHHRFCGTFACSSLVLR